MLRASLQLLLLTVYCWLPHKASAQPLFQVLNNTAGVSKFAKVLQDTGLGVQMSSSGSCSSIRCFLVFAPNNAAMDNAFNADPAAFNSLDKATLVQQHYLSAVPGGVTKGLLSDWPSLDTPVGQDIGFGQTQILRTQSSTLYWSAKQTGSALSYRVNNAAIVVAESNREGDNGVFHVLDQVVLPLGSQLTTNNFFNSPDSAIANQLSVRKSLSYFNNWIRRDNAHDFVYNALRTDNPFKVRTLFLPSDAAWDRIPSSVMQNLNNSVDEFRRVLVAHFAPNITVFTGWLTPGSSINFTTGTGDIAVFNDSKMYLNSAQKAFVSVGGVVAQFVDKSINYPISDSVIHVVDRVLAFAYEDLLTLSQAHAPGFYSACSSISSCLNLLRSNDTQLTLFAPNDVSSLSGIGNATQLEHLLMLHFVPRMVSKPSMKESDLLTSVNNAGHIRFKMYNGETKYYVEGRLSGRGFVRAELRMFDQPAKNGIFHTIARPLGHPVDTVKDLINAHEALTSIRQYMGSNAFQPDLGLTTTSYTVFPPTDAAMTAFMNYRSSTGASTGQVILQSASLRDRVFRRMVLPNQRIVADAAPAGATEYATANTAENEMITVSLGISAGLATRTMQLTGSSLMANVSLSVGLYECTNGMVYPSDSVLFRDNDVEGFTRSAPATSAGSWTVMAMSLTALLALRLLSYRQ